MPHTPAICSTSGGQAALQESKFGFKFKLRSVHTLWSAWVGAGASTTVLWSKACHVPPGTSPASRVPPLLCQMAESHLAPLPHLMASIAPSLLNLHLTPCSVACPPPLHPRNLMNSPSSFTRPCDGPGYLESSAVRDGALPLHQGPPAR